MLTTTSGTNWPSGAGIFGVQVGEDPDTDAELCQVTRSGSTLTLDASTLTKAHTAGANIYYLTTAADINAKQDSDSDLIAIAALSPSNDDVMQRKSGAWANRSLAQIRADLQAVSSWVFSSIVQFAGGARVQSGQPLYFRSTGTSEKIDSPGSGKITLYVSGAVADITATGLDVVLGKVLSTQGYFLEVPYLAYETVAIVASDPSVIFIDPISPIADFDIDLPGDPSDYRRIHNASAFDVTLTSAGGTGTFDGASSFVLLAGKAARFREDGQAIANYVREVEA